MEREGRGWKVVFLWVLCPRLLLLENAVSFCLRDPSVLNGSLTLSSCSQSSYKNGTATEMSLRDREYYFNLPRGESKRWIKK